MSDSEISENNINFVLGQILVKISNLEDGFNRVENFDNRLQGVEKDIVETKSELSSIKKDIHSIRASIDKPKAPWWSIASGIGSIVAIVIGSVAILNLISI